MINVVLVDDVPFFLNKIQEYVESFFHQHNYVYKLHIFSEYNTHFFNLINQNLENMICLFDIETKHANGIDVARRIRQYNQDLEIVFLTVHNTQEYKDKIVISNIKSMGFIPKDNIDQNFFKKMEEFLENVRSRELICLCDGSYSHSLSIKDINYITTDKSKKKTVIKTLHGDLFTSLSLKEVENVLAKKSKYFVKVHRSYIVNILQIMTIQLSKKQIIFMNHDMVDSISKMYKDDFIDAWNEFCSSQNIDNDHICL